jgi:3-hydroxyisobutyrate dehydrogenase
MAHRLVSRAFPVFGFDVNPDAGRRLVAAGGRAAATPAQAVEGAMRLIIVVANSVQAEQVLFGTDGAAEALTNGSAVMLCSTVPPDFVRTLAERLGAKGIALLDAPLSGGTVRAGNGELTVMASGAPETFAIFEDVLGTVAQTVYRLGEQPGQGSTFKMINQLLAGVHIAAASEAMAFAARNGLDTGKVFEVIANSAGASWMFCNRVPHMLAGDYTPHSALEIFVKDLGIVLDEGHRLRFPLPLSAAAHQLFLMGSAAGFGGDDDASVVRVFEQIAGVKVQSDSTSDT